MVITAESYICKGRGSNKLSAIIFFTDVDVQRERFLLSTELFSIGKSPAQHPGYQQAPSSAG